MRQGNGTHSPPGRLSVMLHSSVGSRRSVHTSKVRRRCAPGHPLERWCGVCNKQRPARTRERCRVFLIIVIPVLQTVLHLGNRAPGRPYVDTCSSGAVPSCDGVTYLCAEPRRPVTGSVGIDAQGAMARPTVLSARSSSTGLEAVSLDTQC